MRTIKLGWVAVVLVLAAVPHAAAGTCAPGMGNARDWLATFDAVFIGRVLEVRPSEPAQPFSVVTLKVKSAWKGIDQASVTLRDHPIFSTGFIVGKQYLVYAKRDPATSMLTVMDCGETREVAQSKEAISQLGRPIYRPRGK